MNSKTEMCDLLEVIFDAKDSMRYTAILTGEDYDTIGDLAYMFDRPPVVTQMDKELEEVGISGSASKRITDAVVFIFHAGNDRAKNRCILSASRRKDSACTRGLGKVRFDNDSKISIAKILGDTSIQDSKGRIYSAVSEWIVSQLNSGSNDSEVESPPTKMDGEIVAVPPMPPPAAPDHPAAANEGSVVDDE